ncbi:hypothetical protein ACEE23_00290 [Corynebacterium sp. 32222D000AT]|uniref:hypothetical protein n=1 Tax=unclassified Corynebacterium TaxID=2624378 RepID=UPI002A974541|nr:hypothetical protein [Mycobacteriaceae bacterium]MDY5829529.1 hypothetical protein [Corynebacterium sp.]
MALLNFSHSGSAPSADTLIPGGLTRSDDWFALGKTAYDFADGKVYLGAWSRVALHGIQDQEAVAHGLGQLSWPGSAHQILASPLSDAAREFARGLADRLAEDGAVGPPGSARVAIGAGDEPLQVVPARFRVALAGSSFTVFRGAEELASHAAQEDAWEHVRELLQQEAADAADMAGGAGTGDANTDTGSVGPIGWLGDHRDDGLVDLGTALPEGVLPAEYATLLGHLGVPITVTPFGGLVLHGLAEGDADVVLRVLAPRGFIFDASAVSPEGIISPMD